MNTFLHQVLSGLATGGIYASIALALVMIHQATHLVNFAQGEMAMFSTYLAWAMIDAGIPYWEAFFATIVLSLIGAIVITLVVLVLLFAFFRYTPLGLAMRAAAENKVSSRLVGIRVGWMLALGWGLAAAIGAVAGMMVAPIVFLDPNMMS